MKIVFSDEKMFDIDGVYNSENDRMRAVNRADVDEKGTIMQKRKFLHKVMVWLHVCSKGFDHQPFLKKVQWIMLDIYKTGFL